MMVASGAQTWLRLIIVISLEGYVIGRHFYSRQMDTAVLLSKLKNVFKHDFELLEGPVF